MTTTVNLLLKANATTLSSQLYSELEKAVSNSSCWTLEKKASVNGIQLRIKAYSDKLEKLHDALLRTGIDLQDGAAEMMQNAANQYSVFRDIEVMLIVNEIPLNDELMFNEASINTIGAVL